MRVAAVGLVVLEGFKLLVQVFGVPRLVQMQTRSGHTYIVYTVKYLYSLDIGTP